MQIGTGACLRTTPFLGTFSIPCSQITLTLGTTLSKIFPTAKTIPPHSKRAQKSSARISRKNIPCIKMKYFHRNLQVFEKIPISLSHLSHIELCFLFCIATSLSFHFLIMISCVAYFQISLYSTIVATRTAKWNLLRIKR